MLIKKIETFCVWWFFFHQTTHQGYHSWELILIYRIMFYCLNAMLYVDVFCSVQSLSRVPLFVTPWTEAHQDRLPCPSPTPRVYSCPLNWWCCPTTSSSVVPFSSCHQSFPASGSSLISQFFASGGQSIGVSVSTSILPMNIQDWFPLGWTGWMSLQSKGLSRVFSNTTVQTHQFFGTQLSLEKAMATHSSTLAWKIPWAEGPAC